MIVGHRPFRAADAVGVAASILRDEPTLITEIKPGVPRDLERLVAEEYFSDGCSTFWPGFRS